MCGVNIILLGGIAVVPKTKQVKLEEALDKAPDLLYNNYDATQPALSLNFEGFHDAYGMRFKSKKTAGTDGKEEEFEEIKFGDLVFESRGGRLQEDSMFSMVAYSSESEVERHQAAGKPGH
jgi:hypothetical protein